MTSWHSLSEYWQQIIRDCFPDTQDIASNPEKLERVLTSPTLRIVGKGGMHPSLEYPVDTLEGIEMFSKLENLFISYTSISSLEPLKGLQNLRCLFANNNQLERLTGIEHCLYLETLVVNDNALTSIEEVKNLLNLKEFSCVHNPTLESFNGIHEGHAKNLEKFSGLPNRGVPLSEIKRVEDECGIRVWRG